MHVAQIDRCFGFDTAVEESQRALLAAKVEAASAYKGIGLVKLMGRQSGFIAMQASMASGASSFGAAHACSQGFQEGLSERHRVLGGHKCSQGATLTEEALACWRPVLAVHACNTGC
jgi:hypothetical protein